MRLILLLLIILYLHIPIVGQNPDDWTGFEFKQFDKTLFGDYTFNEIQKDYTLSLPDYFLDNKKLPKSCNGQAEFYRNWAMELPICDWNFLKLEKGGILTIKQGYRWDGATNGTVDRYHNHRSSLLHDAIYDLMRLEYLEPDNLNADTIDLNFTGYHNRKMADMIFYMIAIEDGDTKNGAKTDYFFVRTAGWPGPRLPGRVRSWKYHVSELTAEFVDNEINLQWEPNEWYINKDNINDIPEYMIYRDGEIIEFIKAYTIIDSTKNKIQFLNTYTDKHIEKGRQYTYQLKTTNTDVNKYDWSNEVTVVADNVSIDNNISDNTKSLSIHNYPNPFKQHTTIEFYLDKPGKVLLSIFNSKGQLISKPVDGYFKKGFHKINWNSENLARSIYICCLDTATYTAFIKITKY